VAAERLGGGSLFFPGWKARGLYGAIAEISVVEGPESDPMLTVAGGRFTDFDHLWAYVSAVMSLNVID
jgi:hypothetical protein